jgi:hypothetical protein
MSRRKIDHGSIEAAKHGIARSPHWRAVEKQHLKSNPLCVACGKASKAGLQVHHHFPFHYAIALGRPDLELDQRNLITLCETEVGKPGNNHHLDIGHLDNFKSSNLDVVTDARKTFHGMTSEQIEVDKRWRKKIANRLKPLNLMTGAEKKAFRKLMDSTYPRLTPKKST